MLLYSLGVSPEGWDYMDVDPTGVLRINPLGFFSVVLIPRFFLLS